MSRLARRGLVALSLMVLTATALGLAARLGRVPSLFVHFPVQLGALALLGTFGHLAFRQRGWAMATALIALFHAARILPCYLGAPAFPIAGAELKVITLNLLKDNAETRRVEEFVRTERPDLLVLQEVQDDWAERLERSLTRDFAHVRFQVGIGLLSRHPLRDVHLIEVTPGDRAVLARFTWLPPGGPVRVIAAHLHTPKAKSFAKRQVELEALRKELESTPGPALVLGDLNTTPWAPDHRDLLAGTAWVDARRGRGIQPTRCHITHPLLGSWLRPLGEFLAVPIDHVFTTADLPVTALRTGPDVGSDHLPLVATLRQPSGRD